jgi:hypothetical protein
VRGLFRGGLPEIWALRLWAAVLACLVLPVAAGNRTWAAVTVVYRTGFEQAEGYDLSYTLDGQQNWLADGTGGNGVYTNLFGLLEFGQQAYVGLFEPLIPGEQALTVWRPLNLGTLPPQTPMVRFSVWMEIFDSLEYLFYDRFQWSVYATNRAETGGISTNGLLWFTLDFNNWDRTINYRLQGQTNYTWTGWGFDNEALYQVQILMDFARNRWSATVSDAVVVTNQPITTDGSPLSLGAIAAVWVYRNPNTPGDNYMVFDDYEVRREPGLIPHLEPIAHATGFFALRLAGEPGRRYAIDASTNLTVWMPLRTNTTDLTLGTFDFADRDARTRLRFYRGRLVP